MPVPFISATDLENYLGRAPDTDKAAIAVDSACDILCKASNQKLYYTASDTVTLDSDGTDVILLPEMPAYTPTAVVGPASIAMVSGTDYYFDQEMGAITTLKSDRYFLPGRKLYTVTYSHGYVSDDSVPGLPAGVLEWPSALRMLALQVASRLMDQGLVQQETVGSYVAIYSAREGNVLTDRERSLLARIVDVGRRR